MLNKVMKRFYKQANLAEVAGGFAVQLDGRTVKTPATRKLELPTRLLAEAVVAEWDAQGDEIKPATMPLTQLASTALDRVGPERVTIREQLGKFAETDLLCYRANFPPSLVQRQVEQWQPLLDWAAQALDARLEVTIGVMAVTQPAPAVAALLACVDGYDCWRLTAVQAACAAAGSLVLALALGEGRLTGEQVFELSQLDEIFQAEQWGEDREAVEQRRALKRDIVASERLLKLL